VFVVEFGPIRTLGNTYVMTHGDNTFVHDGGLEFLLRFLLVADVSIEAEIEHWLYFPTGVDSACTPPLAPLNPLDLQS
jgi:hypothetical protein